MIIKATTRLERRESSYSQKTEQVYFWSSTKCRKRKEANSMKNILIRANFRGLLFLSRLSGPGPKTARTVSPPGGQSGQEGGASRGLSCATLGGKGTVDKKVGREG